MAVASDRATISLIRAYPHDFVTMITITCIAVHLSARQGCGEPIPCGFPVASADTFAGAFRDAFCTTLLFAPVSRFNKAVITCINI